MPIYEYLCGDCGNPFEEVVRSFDATVSCPHCAGGQIERQLSVFSSQSAGALSSSDAATRGGSFNGGSGCGGGCG
jgi:putative FmdB family regulatory protein